MKSNLNLTAALFFILADLSSAQQPAAPPPAPLQLLPWAATNNATEQNEFSQAATMLTAAFQALQGGTNSPLQAIGAAQPVDFRKLRDWLPQNLGGLDRSGQMGEKTGAMGFSVARAEAEYGQPGQAWIKTSITDLAALGPMASMASLGWTSAEVDRETSTGYERTTTIQGNRALEKYDNKSRSGSASLMAGGRFLIEIEGQNIDATQIPAALKALDFNALQAIGSNVQAP
jgi:hypothetical protein